MSILTELFVKTLAGSTRLSVIGRISLAVVIAMPLRVGSVGAQNPAREFLDGYRATFSTLGHPKAKGVNLTIAYPSSWMAKEGERPNVVQKFVSEGGRGMEMFLIITKALPVPEGTVITIAELRDIFGSPELRESVPPGAVLIDARETTIEAMPAGILEYRQIENRAGISVEIQVISYIFVQGTTLVQVMCSVGQLPSRRDLSLRMDSYRPLFSLIANSIVLPDRWTGTLTSNQEQEREPSSVPGGNSDLVVLLFFGLIVTWGIGLAPALIIRYGVVRSPLERKKASWIAGGFCGVFWLFGRMLATVEGGYSGTGAVWVLVFFASVWIMNKGYTKHASGAE